MKYKRGDESPNGKYRFWSYRMGAEGWVSAEKYETLRQRDLYLRKVSYMAPGLLDEARQQPTPQ